MVDDNIQPRKRKKGTLDWFVQKSTSIEASSLQLPTSASLIPQPQASGLEKEFPSPTHNTPQTQEVGSAPTTHGIPTTSASRERQSQLDVNSLPHDPDKRKKIVDYHPMDQDAVQREYIQRGPCQPREHKFPKTDFGGGAQTVGICYGMLGNNLPQPSEVVALFRSRGIGRTRLYDPNHGALQALRGSNVELILGVPNSDLQSLAYDTSAATRWVQTNVLNFWPDVRIRYIAVGNEVSPVNGNSQFASFLVPAMTNIYNAVLAAGLWGQVRVTTSLDTGVIGTSYPPSAGAFRADVMWFMNPIIGFLTGTRAPLLVNIYPYFSYIYNPGMKISYALFTNGSPEFIDSGNNLPYQNLFDAMLDGFYSALEKASGSSLEIVVSESGWPSNAGTATTIDNACTYNQNLIRHVRGGSPKRPGRAIETYLFAMFNENLKNPDYEKFFGLFYPNQQAVCTINFFEQVSDM